MKHHRKTSHAVYDIKFHVVWITKYRKPVLSGEAFRLTETCNSYADQSKNP